MFNVCTITAPPNLILYLILYLPCKPLDEYQWDSSTTIPQPPPLRRLTLLGTFCLKTALVIASLSWRRKTGGWSVNIYPEVLWICV